MYNDDDELLPRYRMPRVFGALPGPRNMPRSRSALTGQVDFCSVSVEMETDADLLMALLPPRMRLADNAMLRVAINYLSNIGWLAGRGYNILQLTVPVIVEGDEGEVVADFMPVLWESMADPIMTGREELGFAKLFADIAPLQFMGDSVTCSAGWHGFRWFEMQLDHLIDSTPPAPAAVASAGLVHHRYLPDITRGGQADINQLVLVPPTYSGGSHTEFTTRRTGQATLRFSPARWEDVPLQYPILNALAALPVIRLRNASVVSGTTRGTEPLGLGLRVLVQDLGR